jgi:hypothetical protein
MVRAADSRTIEVTLSSDLAFIGSRAYGTDIAAVLGEGITFVSGKGQQKKLSKGIHL